MERTNKKECPKCKSIDVVYIKVRMGDVVILKRGGEYPEPRHPVYECNNCGETFILIDE